MLKIFGFLVYIISKFYPGFQIVSKYFYLFIFSGKVFVFLLVFFFGWKVVFFASYKWIGLDLCWESCFGYFLLLDYMGWCHPLMFQLLILFMLFRHFFLCSWIGVSSLFLLSFRVDIHIWQCPLLWFGIRPSGVPHFGLGNWFTFIKSLLDIGFNSTNNLAMQIY